MPLAAARHDLSLTTRLLGIGLPLSIVAGTAVAVVLFPSFPLALAGLIAASLAPTDAALSASVIADERLPIGSGGCSTSRAASTTASPHPS